MLILVRRRSKKERTGSSVKDIQHEIVVEIAVLSKSDSGYTKEVNLVS